MSKKKIPWIFLWAWPAFLLLLGFTGQYPHATASYALGRKIDMTCGLLLFLGLPVIIPLGFIYWKKFEEPLRKSTLAIFSAVVFIYLAFFGLLASVGPFGFSLSDVSVRLTLIALLISACILERSNLIKALNLAQRPTWFYLGLLGSMYLFALYLGFTPQFMGTIFFCICMIFLVPAIRHFARIQRHEIRVFTFCICALATLLIICVLSYETFRANGIWVARILHIFPFIRHSFGGCIFVPLDPLSVLANFVLLFSLIYPTTIMAGKLPMQKRILPTFSIFLSVLVLLTLSWILKVGL